MPVEVELIRKPYGFKPKSAFDEQEIALFAIGQTVRASIILPKSERQHRFYRSLVADLAEAVGKTRAEVDLQIRVACGQVKEATVIDGRVEFITVSTKDMDHATFNAFVEAAQAKIVELFPDAGAEIVNAAWAKLNGYQP
jgi:hypothetical protein